MSAALDAGILNETRLGKLLHGKAPLRCPKQVGNCCHGLVPGGARPSSLYADILPVVHTLEMNLFDAPVRQD